jgi:hypothetical protein
MRNSLTVLVVLVVSLAPNVGFAQARSVPPATVTAIDIALEPDVTMLRHAAALNARLRLSFPKGYALDASHRPHVTMLQRYVRTADLPKVYVTVILAKPPADVVTAQQQIIDAIAPYTVATGTAAAFDTTPAEPDINASTISYVAEFVPKSSGKNYIAHVTCGVASVAFVKTLEAEPFTPFTFSPVAVSVYQLGNFGTARKKLKEWMFTP